MKKISFSLLGGVLIGLVISFVLMDYKVISYEIRNQGGIESRWVREMDFDFVFNASLLVIGSFILIFIIWTFIEKMIDKKHLTNLK
jgi:hypothetical protein